MGSETAVRTRLSAPFAVVQFLSDALDMPFGSEETLRLPEPYRLRRSYLSILPYWRFRLFLPDE